MYKAFLDSVFFIYQDAKTYDVTAPWNLYNEDYDISGTGFVIEIGVIQSGGEKAKRPGATQKYLITNAHNIKYATPIRVHSKTREYTAVPVFVMRECDLALLEIEDPARLSIGNDFWTGVPVCEFGDPPESGDRIYVVGYPHGENNLSVAAGTVNRLSTIEYHSFVSGVAIQIDAPVNSGNSGGPVFSKSGKVTGIAFKSKIGEAIQNMNYMIPTFIIEYFINTFMLIRAGKIPSPGIGVVNFSYQTDVGAPIRDAYGIPSSAKNGLLVTDVPSDKFGSDPGNQQIRSSHGSDPGNQQIRSSHGSDSVARGDYIVGGKNFTLNYQGTIPVTNRDGKVIKIGNIGFREYISITPPDAPVALQVIRAGKLITVNYNPVRMSYICLEPKVPGYLFIGPLLFVVVSDEYIELQRENKKIYKHLLDRIRAPSKIGNREIIVLADVFNNALNINIRVSNNYVLRGINGVPVATLHELHLAYEKLLASPESNIILYFSSPVHFITGMYKSDVIRDQKNIIMEQVGFSIPGYRQQTYF